MNPRRRDALLRVAFIVLISVIGFAFCQHVARSLETHAAAMLVRLIGGHKRSFVFGGTSIVVVPFHGQAFRAVITPSCSSIGSVLAIGCLSVLAPPASRTRRRVAVFAAVATVVVGNISRIAASVIVGLFMGRSSLVLFHDWIGGVMTFVYTLGGFIVFLHILLPDRRREAARDARRSPTPAREETAGAV